MASAITDERRYSLLDTVDPDLMTRAMKNDCEMVGIGRSYTQASERGGGRAS